MDLRMNLIKKFVSGEKILDVGGYIGTLHDELVKQYSQDHVWCLDIILEKETNRSFKGNAEKMPFDDAFFDTIIAGELIEHLENPNKFVKECMRVLKPKGVVIITTPNVKSLINRIFRNYYHLHHIVLYDENALKRIFEENGFETIHLSYLPYTEHSSFGKSGDFGFFKNLIKNKGRKVVHYLVPNKLREEMIFVAVKLEKPHTKKSV